MLDQDHPWLAVPQWPAHWIYPPSEQQATPVVGWFRLKFVLPQNQTLRFSVTGDERFDLWLDGATIGNGPDRGSLAHWYYATYEVELKAGAHEFLGRAWALGPLAPVAQLGVRCGFLLAGHGQAHALISTGVALWQWQHCAAWNFESNGLATPNEHIDGAHLKPQDAWTSPVVGEPGNNGKLMYPDKKARLLTPSELPAMRRAPWPKPPQPVHADRMDLDALFFQDNATTADDILQWTRLLHNQQALTVGALRRVRILVDMQVYGCGRLYLRTEGGKGATIRSRWGEALALAADANANSTEVTMAKGRRDQWQAGQLQGYTDIFKCAGQTHVFSTLWWRSGRWLALEIATGEDPLTLSELSIEETGFGPAEMTLSTLNPSDQALLNACLRTLQSCTHETTTDCPHYEQLAYAGDARVQLICWAAILPDQTRALYRHTLQQFHASTANPGGWCASSAPSRGAQTIPTFALWWIMMAQDYQKQFSDTHFLRPLLPAMRSMIERWILEQDQETGLYISPDGWNFVDAAFPGGVPPGALPGGCSGLLNWLLLLALQAMKELELAVSEPLLAQRWQILERTLYQALIKTTWHSPNGVFLDAPGHTGDISEHAQVLALLYPQLDTVYRIRLVRWLQRQTLLTSGDGVRCQAFFCYYLFQAMQLAGSDEYVAQRLGPWRNLLEQGFTTTPEHFGPTRSDCHGWSAHPILLLLQK